MSASFRIGSANGPGRSSTKEIKVPTRTRSPSPSPNKNSPSATNGSPSSTARSRSPDKGYSRSNVNPPQSIIDTAHQTVKEAISQIEIENILHMVNDQLMTYKSNRDINAELELYEKQKVSKKVDSGQLKVNQRESSSARRKLVSNYSKNKMVSSSKKRNNEGDISDKTKARGSAGKDPGDLTVSDSSVNLNTSGPIINSIPSLDYGAAFDYMTQKGKEVKQNNCNKHTKLIDDLCDRIMDDSDTITLTQVNYLLMQLKWKLLNYDIKVKKCPIITDGSNSNIMLNKDSLANVASSSHCEAPINNDQSEPGSCQSKLNVSTQFSDSDNNNIAKCKIPKSKFPNKDTVKFGGVMKIDTSTWNNKNKQRALLNIGTSKEIKSSNLDVDNSKKSTEKQRERRKEKLPILRPSSYSKCDVKESDQSVQKKSKISDERRLDDRSVEKGLTESRSLNKERKQARESYRGEMSGATHDHKHILSQMQKSFKEYVENAKDKERKESVKQIKAKKLSDFQSRSVVKKPLDACKNKVKAEPSYLNCPESRVNILDAEGSNAIYDGAFSGENNFQEWLDGKKNIQRKSNSVARFKQEIIDVDEEKKLRSGSRNSPDSKGSKLKIATSQSKIKILKNSCLSYTDSLQIPVESLMTSIDLNTGQIKPTNSQMLRISLLNAGANVSNMSLRSEHNPSTTSFRDMKNLEDFMG